MAKPDIQIEVSLDPDVMELLRNLVARVEALEAALAGEPEASHATPHYDLGYMGEPGRDAEGFSTRCSICGKEAGHAYSCTSSR